MKRGSGMMAVIINYGAVKLNSVLELSGLFWGENVQQGSAMPDKFNITSAISGYGDVVCSEVNIVNDFDLVDALCCRMNNNANLAPTIVKSL
jgi:hypothetical protein